MRKYLKAKYKEWQEEGYEDRNYPTKSKSVWGGVFVILMYMIIILFVTQMSIMWILAIIPITTYLIFVIIYYVYILPLKYYEEKYGSCGLGDAYRKLETKAK